MAAPFAYAQPTIQKSWDALLLHIPVLLASWLAGLAVTLAGVVVMVVFSIVLTVFAQAGADQVVVLGSLLTPLAQLPFAILVSLLGVLMVAVPALYYEHGEVVSIGAAVQLLSRRFWRYVLAGVLFSVMLTIGLLFCILPGIAVALVTPVFVNRIFVTEMSIGDAFSQAFQQVYRSKDGFAFIAIEVLTLFLVLIVSLLTCGLASVFAVPMACFYLQNVGYRTGVLH